MPTTKLKNTLYRLALPLRAPRLERHPICTAQGSHLYTYDAYIRLLRKHHVLGSAALLREGDQSIMLLCSSQQPNHPVTAHSLFRVASITKMATSLAALRAVEQGKLDLESPILSYFPSLSEVSDLKGITLQHLLSHTSGLQDPINLESAMTQGIPFPDLVAGCRKSLPGAEFHYSNLGYGLIGCLLEAVYEQPVSLIFQRLVFQPLEMRATLDASTLNLQDVVPLTRVLPYHPGQDLQITELGKKPLQKPDPLRHYGHTAGAMYLDLSSLEKLVLCLMQEGHPLLSTNLGQRMTQKQAAYGKISPTLSYGWGILRIVDASLSSSVILGHQGFAYGCADGAFWEEKTGRMVLFLNGGASEARKGRLGVCNYDLLRWALRKEMPQWSR
ncbi:MAG: beta-lactamase family protein [Clostridia bacterium]|nr:beta-lactamase family protein [Clostridia bacterium]